MIKFTLTDVRPDTSVPFYANTAADSQYIIDNYVTTGKIVERTKTVSEDGLTQISVFVYATAADRDAFSKDATVQSAIETRRAYNTEHQIVETSKIQEV